MKESRLFELKVLETLRSAEAAQKRSRELLAQSEQILARRKKKLQANRPQEYSFLRDSHKTYIAAMREEE